MRDFFLLLCSAADFVTEVIPCLLSFVAAEFAERRRELRRQRMADRIMRRLIRNPSEVEMLRVRLSRVRDNLRSTELVEYTP